MRTPDIGARDDGSAVQGSDDLLAALSSLHAALNRILDNPAPVPPSDTAGQVTVQHVQALELLMSAAAKMRGFAAATGLSYGGATALADRLVGIGAVHRKVDDRDRRVVWLVLTDLGRELVESYRRRQREALDALLAQMPHGSAAALARRVKELTSLLEPPRHHPG